MLMSSEFSFVGSCFTGSSLAAGTQVEDDVGYIVVGLCVVPS